MKMLKELAAFIDKNLLTLGADKSLLPTANIASDLGPRVGNRIGNSTRIKIVGGKCKNLTNNSGEGHYPQKWIDLLQKWHDAGATISYLVIDADKITIDALQALKERFAHRFDHHSLNTSEIADPELQQRAKESIEFHFVIFENPNLLWLEGSHPSGSTTAFNCEFLDEKRASVDARYERLKARFEDFLDACCLIPA